MRKLLTAIALAAGLAGCATTREVEQAPAPVVTVEGPRFAASAFACGVEPSPPPAADRAREGSSAARFETSLEAWGRTCQRKLKSVGRLLEGAGQVEQ